MKNFIKVTTVALCVSASLQASALYIELSPGYTTSSHATIFTANNEANSDQQKHIGWNVDVGQQFLGLIGVEAGYTRYGALDWQQAGSPTSNSQLSSYDVAAVLRHGVGPIFLQAKLGYGHLTRSSFNFDNYAIGSQARSGVFWGVGGGLDINSNWYAVLQYQQAEGDNSVPNVGLTSLGVGYKF